MNREYIKKLVIKNRNGRILKLLRENLYNWSIDDFEYIYYCYDYSYRCNCKNKTFDITKYFMNIFPKFNEMNVLYFMDRRNQLPYLYKLYEKCSNYIKNNKNNTSIFDDICDYVRHSNIVNLKNNRDFIKYILSNEMLIKTCCIFRHHHLEYKTYNDGYIRKILTLFSNNKRSIHSSNREYIKEYYK